MDDGTGTGSSEARVGGRDRADVEGVGIDRGPAILCDLSTNDDDGGGSDGDAAGGIDVQASGTCATGGIGTTENDGGNEAGTAAALNAALDVNSMELCPRCMPMLMPRPKPSM